MKIRFSMALSLLATLAAGSWLAFDAAQLYVYRAGLAGSLKYDLFFDSAALAIPIAIFLGVCLGAFADAHEPDRIVNGKIERHNERMFFQHWSHTLGTLVLLLTGLALGTLFIPRSLQSPENIGFAMNLHFIGVLFFLVGASYYVTTGVITGELKQMLPRQGDLQAAIGHYKAMFFGGTAPEEEKFMAIERMIFPLWIIGVGGITITGVIKVAAHSWSLPGALLGVTNWLHGAFTIYMALLVVGHVIGGSLLPASWPLIRSMVTGFVSEEYVRQHHGKWYKKISG